MDRLSFYKSFYEIELKKRDDLDKSINNPILIITIIIGAISFISEKMEFGNFSKMNMLLAVTIMLIAILICKSVFHIILSYNNGIKGYSYEIIGTNTDFELYRKDLIAYNKTEGVSSDGEKEYEESVIAELVKCSDINNELNIKRSYQIFLTKKYVIISLIFTFITLILHFLKQII